MDPRLSRVDPYFNPTTIPSGAISLATCVRLNPTSFIHLRQSSPELVDL